VTATPLAPQSQTERSPTDPRQAAAVRAMLEARSIALVGASARPGSLGERMIHEVGRSASRPRTYLVNPRYSDIGGVPCLPSLADLPEPVDLAILAVPDTALEEQLAAAARANARSAIIFGSAFDPPGTSGLRDRLATTAKAAGMALCGAGCMGFVNLARGLLAVGYLLPDPVPAGPVALITHSGSVFTAMLNARRGFGFTLAASPGQELVTGAPAFARYALSLPETRVLALVLEAIRDGDQLREVLGDALAADVPVVLLSAGGSPAGKALVAAHSGALAAADGAWEALAGAYGVHRVRDLAELADTLELFSSGRRCAPGGGIATVHDSGLERAHVADLAAEFGVPFAPIGPQTTARLAAALDPGLEPANPLDLWGTGRDPEPVATECLSALAADPAVTAVALAVDLAPEWDGDEAYPRAVIATASGTAKPVVVLTGLPATVDPVAAATMRTAGVPVLEGTRSGLLALRHLLDHADRPTPNQVPADPEPMDPERRQRWARLLSETTPDSATLFDLLRDYGIPAVRARSAATMGEALEAAAEIGYPVVLKTDEPNIAHKSDVGGVCLGLGDPQAVADAYDDLSDRLGPRVLVCETAAPGTEVALGLTRDPALGPLLVIGAGGLLIEILAERAVVLPPVTPAQARVVISRLRLARILAGARGQAAADLDAIADAITGLSALACDLGDVLDALDINPLICGPNGAVAADVLAVPRLGPGTATIVAMGHGRERYLARAALFAAVIGTVISLAAGCSSSSSSGTSAPATSTHSASATSPASAAGFISITEPFDPGHPAMLKPAPANCGSQPSTLTMEQCYDTKTENTDFEIDAVQQAKYAAASAAGKAAILAQDKAWLDARAPVCTVAFNTGGTLDEVEIASCLLDESTSRLWAVKGLTPPVDMLKGTDNSDPDFFSWYTTPEGSRIAELSTQGDQSGTGSIIAWTIIGGADGFIINPKQFYYADGSFTDSGTIVGPNPTYHKVAAGVEYVFDIDYSHLNQAPTGNASAGFEYVPGTPVAIWS